MSSVQLSYRPCLRCGRWFEPGTTNICSAQQQIHPQAPSILTVPLPLPLKCLETNPAIVNVWNKMNHHNHQQAGTNNHDESTSAASLMSSSSSNNIGGLSSAAAVAAASASNWGVFNLLGRQRHDEEQEIDAANRARQTDEDFVGVTFCAHPDCRYSPYETDTSRAALGMERWEHSVACSACGRVWPLPVLHPSSYSTETRYTMLEKSNIPRMRVKFLCCDYPEAWGRVVLERQQASLMMMQQQQPPQTMTQQKKVELAAVQQCPSLCAADASTAMAMSSTQLLQGHSPLLPHTGERLAIKPVFSHGLTCCADTSLFFSAAANEAQQAAAAAAAAKAKALKPKGKPKQAANNKDAALNSASNETTAMPPSALEFIAAPVPKAASTANFSSSAVAAAAAVHLTTTEPIRVSKARNREMELFTRKRLELAATGQDVLPDTPVMERLQSSGIPKNSNMNNNNLCVANEDDDDDPFATTAILVSSASSATASAASWKKSDQTSSSRSAHHNNNNNNNNNNDNGTRPAVSPFNQKLYQTVRTVSIVFARAGLVGVADPFVTACMPPTWISHSASSLNDEEDDGAETAAAAAAAAAAKATAKRAGGKKKQVTVVVEPTSTTTRAAVPRPKPKREVMRKPAAKRRARKDADESSRSGSSSDDDHDNEVVEVSRPANKDDDEGENVPTEGKKPKRAAAAKPSVKKAKAKPAAAAASSSASKKTASKSTEAASSFSSAAAAAAADNKKPLPAAPLEDPDAIQWSQCEDCEKWRVLGYSDRNPYAEGKGKRFRCADLGDGTTCAKDPDEGGCKLPAQLKLYRRRYPAAHIVNRE